MKNSFVFYRSYFEAIAELDDNNQLEIYKAISRYSLNNEEPNLKGALKAIFIAIKPQIDANNKKYESGCRGGRPKKNAEEDFITTGFKSNKNQETFGYANTKPNNNQTITKVKPNENENVNDKKEKYKKEKTNFSFYDLNFIDNSDFKDLMKEWLEYKKELKDSYKSQKSIQLCYKNLLALSNNDITVARQIVNNSIANGYKGLFELKEKTIDKIDKIKDGDFWQTNSESFRKYETGSLKYESLDLLKKLSDDVWISEYQKVQAENMKHLAETKILSDGQLMMIQGMLVKYKVGDQ